VLRDAACTMDAIRPEAGPISPEVACPKGRGAHASAVRAGWRRGFVAVPPTVSPAAHLTVGFDALCHAAHARPAKHGA
jgi:hypothetical protein